MLQPLCDYTANSLEYDTPASVGGRSGALAVMAPLAFRLQVVLFTTRDRYSFLVRLKRSVVQKADRANLERLARFLEVTVSSHYSRDALADLLYLRMRRLSKSAKQPKRAAA